MDEAVTMERDGVGQRGRRRRERRKRGNIGNEGSASDLSSAQRIITCLPGCREHQQQQSTTVSVRCCSCTRFLKSCQGKMLTDTVLCEQAQWLGDELRYMPEKFKASSGWLENFKHHYGIWCRQYNGLAVGVAQPVQGCGRAQGVDCIWGAPDAAHAGGS